jgi:hypothetical protein
MQPGKREDVQLLGQWLQHATHDKKCEDPDGHIADIDCSFVIHSIAFLEVIRQVYHTSSIDIHLRPEHLSGTFTIHAHYRS